LGSFASNEDEDEDEGFQWIIVETEIEQISRVEYFQSSKSVSHADMNDDLSLKDFGNLSIYSTEIGDSENIC
jgi:hypothetical protein